VSLSPEEISAFAEQLMSARMRGQAIAVPARSLSSITEAYRIQDAVATRFGPVVGWKVGATSPAGLPTCAPLLAGTVVADGRRTIGAGVSHVGIELEMAFRIGRAFALCRRPLSDAEIVDAIESAHVAVELCRSRFIDGPLAPALWLLADNQINHLLIIGPAISHWRDIEDNPPVTQLSINGDCVAVNAAGHPAESPRLLAWLVRHVTDERGGLAAGSVVSTGSWTGLRWIKPPAVIEGEFGGKDRITVELSAQREDVRQSTPHAGQAGTSCRSQGRGHAGPHFARHGRAGDRSPGPAFKAFGLKALAGIMTVPRPRARCSSEAALVSWTAFSGARATA
jgi:2-keto-4-pentenoate hydratase